MKAFSMENKENLEEQKKADNEEAEVTPRPVIKSCYFRVGEKEFSIDIKSIKEIVEPLDITPLPLSSQYIKGISVLRGEVVPVLNIHDIFSVKDTGDLNKKMIICDSGKGLIGIICDGMPDLRTDFIETIIDIDMFFEKYSIKE